MKFANINSAANKTCVIDSQYWVNHVCTIRYQSSALVQGYKIYRTRFAKTEKKLYIPEILNHASLDNNL